MWINSDTFGKIMAWHTDAILSQVSAMMAEREPPIAREGVVVGGSWDATDGTVEVIAGDTAAILADDNIVPDSGTSIRRLPVLTTHLGDQYGPVGNERALMFPSQSGYHVLLHHGEDDSQTELPAGERWIAHRDPSGNINAFTKLTNDAETMGDGLASHTTLAGGLSKTMTAGGHSSSMSDTTKTIKQQSAGGHQRFISDQVNQIVDQTAGGLETVHDDVTNEVSHIAPKVGLGNRVQSLENAASASGNAAASNALNQAHLTSYDTSLLSGRALDMGTLIAAMEAALIPNAGAILAKLVLGVLPVSVPTSAITPATVPSGSGVVKIAP